MGSKGKLGEEDGGAKAECTAQPANDTESGSSAECHTESGSSPEHSDEMAALPPLCPWRNEIVRAVLLGTHDAQSPLCQLQGQRSVLELIIRS